jgi:(2Fe-2S) ferredoxin/predicted O-methyltransferase YrrM
MEPFRYHVFVCDQQKPEGAPGCCARGSVQVIEALRREIDARGLEDDVQVTTCGSLGLCEWGPNMIVYPEGVWYAGVTPADVPEIVRSHFEENTPVERLARTDAAAVRAEMLANRAKRLAAMKARDAAGALPDDLQDRVRAFQESRAILTALELDVFTALGDGATAAEAAARTGTDARAMEMLLHALASMGLVSKREDAFHNTPVTKRYFTAGSPDNAQPALMHTAHLWGRWSTLTDCVRAGTSVASRQAPDFIGPWTQAFIAAMHRNATERAGWVVRAVGAAEVRRMLDVGGGSGAYSIAFAKANPELTADILDLGEVTLIAQGHIERAGMADRVRVRAGDLRVDKLGEGYDLVFVSAICHMLDENENRDLLGRCRDALRPGGRIVVQEFILQADKTAPKSAALFALNMLVGTRAGSAYSEPEYAAWLAEAGFREIRRVRLPGPAGLMIGTR